jgi:hypothetical protein
VFVNRNTTFLTGTIGVRKNMFNKNLRKANFTLVRMIKVVRVVCMHTPLLIHAKNILYRSN